MRWIGLAALVVASAASGAGDGPAGLTFSQAGPATCGAGGIQATVAFTYPANTLGPIAATYMHLGFEPPLALPPTSGEVRRRFRSLLPGAAKVGAITVETKRLRVPVTTTEQGIPPTRAFQIRFDCPAGSRIRPSDLSCTTAEVVAASGEPLDDALAREVRCLVIGLDPVRR